MPYSQEYMTRFLVITKSNKLQYLRPTVWIERWKKFVTDLEVGYCEDAIELDNDLDILRKPIDYFAKDLLLNTYPEHLEFLKSIEEIDNRFREASFVSTQLDNAHLDWWKKRVIKKGSAEYAACFEYHIRSRMEIIPTA